MSSCIICVGMFACWHIFTLVQLLIDKSPTSKWQSKFFIFFLEKVENDCFARCAVGLRRCRGNS